MNIFCANLSQNQWNHDNRDSTLPVGQIGHGMRKYEKNQIQNWSKINHVHFCAVYMKANDIANFIRHYLFLRTNFAGEYRPLESLRAEVNALTGWDPQAITNAIGRLKKAGEVEQKKTLYRPNPKVGNRFGAYYKNTYEGKEPPYSDEQLALIEELKKIAHTRLLPSNQQEFDEMQAAEEDEVEDMVALMKIEKLEQELSQERQKAEERYQNLMEKMELLVSCIMQDDLTQAKKLATVIPFRVGK
jgi:hypothetical protein